MREVGEEELLVALEADTSCKVEEVFLIFNSGRGALLNFELIAEVKSEYL